MRNYFKVGYRFAAAALIALSSLMSCSDYQDEINNLGKLYEEHEQRLQTIFPHPFQIGHCIFTARKHDHVRVV